MHIQQFLSSRAFIPACIAGLVLFSIVVTPGYRSFSDDQTMFLPPLLRALDPSLFPNDLPHASMISSEWSLINDVLELFVWLGIPLLWTLFILTILFRALFFLALYHCIFYFAEDRFRSAFILLFFLTPFFIPGTGHATLEAAFDYRLVAIALGFSYLALHLRGQQFFSVVPLVFAFLIHAISAMPFFLSHVLLVGRTWWHARKEKQKIYSLLLFGTLPFIAAVGFLLLRNTGATDSFFLRIDEAWKQLANPRNAPAFFAFWDRNSYLSLFGWIALLSIPLISLKQLITIPYKRHAAWILAAATPFFMLMGAAFGEYTSFYGMVKINLQRGLLLLSFFAPILFGMYMLQRVEKYRDNMLENTFLIATAFWFLFKDDFVFLREQFLLFIPPLLLLLHGARVSAIPQKAATFLPLAAVAVFGLFDGAATQRALFYGDAVSVVWFHVILLGGLIFALFYKTTALSSESFTRYTVAAAVPILFICSALFMPSFAIYPKFFSNAPYREACAWIQTHTAKDDIFIVEPFVTDPPPEEFRLACLRPIFTTYKEGGVVPYDKNRAVAFEWKRKYDLVLALKNNFALIDEIKESSRVDYLMSETPISFPSRYRPVFSNSAYYIYDIRN